MWLVLLSLGWINKKVLKDFGSLPENSNFGIRTSVVRSILEGRNVSSPRANKSSISSSKLGRMISDGTYYLSCWMNTAQIMKMRSKKVIFKNLDWPLPKGAIGLCAGFPDLHPLPILTTHPRHSLRHSPYEKPDRHHLPDDCRVYGKYGSVLGCWLPKKV